MEESMMTNLEGKQAPQFTLRNEKGDNVSLADFAGEKYVVLYFYPKDATPGCTTQACDFRDSYEDFNKLNAVILGVSPDDEASHTKFIENKGLPFSLLVDDNHEVSEKYGVWKLKKNFGREYMGIERSTFLINPAGEVVKEWRKVSVKGHIDDALRTLQEITKA
jgi:thioredoxin-dependent peroxiredoxin